MKIYPVIILSFFFFIERSSAQQLSPIVISPSGDFYSNSSGMLSFTVGEMSAVETFTSPFATLTQGFQQYWDFGTSIPEYPNDHFSFGIYPNPSGGRINLFTESELNGYVDVKVLDLVGKEVLRTAFFHQSGINIESIDLAHAAPGMYVVVLTINENQSITSSCFIQKINIIH